MAPQFHVLHVDDDPEFGSLVADYLAVTEDRLTVTTATGVGEGLARIDEMGTEIDCVVSDYDMPGRNGIEFLDAVREHHPDLPFLLFTGKGSEEVASDAISAGATDYLQKGGGREQYELLANRIVNAVEQYRSSRRAANLERLRTLAAEVNQKLVRADTRSAVEREVCAAFAASEPYRMAWIGTVDREANRIIPEVSAGVDDGYLDNLDIALEGDRTARGPAATAIREQTVVATQDIEQFEPFEPYRAAATARGYRSVAAAPLQYDGDRFGIFVVYCSEPNAFDEDERALLAELADDVAHAIHAREVRSDLQRFRTLVDRANDGIFMLDPETGAFVEANDRVCERLGYDRQTLLDGVTLRDVDTRLDEPGDYDELVSRARTSESVLQERTYRCRDGETYPAEIRFNYTTVGGRAYVLGIARDITEQRRRRQRLQRQRDALLQLTTDETVNKGSFEGAVRAITETAADVLDVDRVNVWLFEDDRETLVCIDNYVTHDESHDRGGTLAIDSYPDYFETLQTSRMLAVENAQTDPRTAELVEEYLEPNDVVGLLDATIRSEGEVIGVICHESVGDSRTWSDDETEFAADIADVVNRVHRSWETRQHERELQRIHDRMEFVLAQTNAVIWERDADADQMRIHPMPCPVVGEPIATIDDFLETIRPEDRQSVEAVISSVMETGTARTIEYRAQPALDADWVEMHIETVTDDTGTALIGFARDVTDRRERERRLEQQNRRFDQLASAVSHDLQTPLSAARGRCELALETEDPEHVERALSALERLDELRTDLAETLRSRAIVSETETVPVGETAADLWESMSETGSLEVDGEPTVEADAGAIRRLLENLLSNALEHVGPTVTLRVGETPDGFYIEDDGPGVPPENRRQVFTPGFSTKEDGSGIGMASVREIVLAHGWSISITDGTLGGTRFDIDTTGEP